MQTRILTETVTTPIRPEPRFAFVANEKGTVTPTVFVEGGEVTEKISVTIEGDCITAVEYNVEINEEVDEFALEL